MHRNRLDSHWIVFPATVLALAACASVASPPQAADGPQQSVSPHWPHIRTMITDFRTGRVPEPQRTQEIEWTARHYDWIMSGPIGRYKQLNPNVRVIFYTLYHTVIQARAGAVEEWFAANPQYDINRAFLHGENGERLELVIWRSRRWVFNPGYEGVREYLADRTIQLIRSDPDHPADGVFVDETETRRENRIRGAVEYPGYDQYIADTAGLFEHVHRRLREEFGRDKIIQINPSETMNQDIIDLARAAGAVHMERFNSPKRNMAERWDFIDRLIEQGVLVQFVNMFSDIEYNAMADYPGGNERTQADRGNLFELASFYMVSTRDPDQILFTSYNGPWDRASFEQTWVKAVETDIGLPVEKRRQYQSGEDPNGEKYIVFAREFERALVLVRPQDGWGPWDDSTLVEVALPEDHTWHPLHADGRVGEAITRIGLRKSEGAILLKR